MTEQQIIETLGTKVMGWSQEQVDFLYPAWNPLQSIGDAWQVVDGFEHYKMQSCLNGQKYCEFLYKGRFYGDHGNTLQEAICKAALKTVV